MNRLRKNKLGQPDPLAQASRHTNPTRSSNTHDSSARKKQLVKESSKVSEMLEIMKPITRTPNRNETQERPANTGYTQENSIDRESLDAITPLDNRSENDGTQGDKKIPKSNIPVTMYADFIESGNTGDIDVFLTRVS